MSFKGVEFIFLNNARWLAVNYDKGYSFLVNSLAKLLIEMFVESGGDEVHTISEFSRNYPEVHRDQIHKGLDLLREKSKPEVARGLLRAKLLNSNVFFRLCQSFSFLASGWLFYLNAFLLIAVIYVFISHYHLHYRLTFGEVVAVYVTVLFSFLFHEVGHGAALVRLGYKTGPLGVGIYWIYPVFFVELLTVSVMDRNSRMLVDISGAGFQVLFGSVLALTSIFFYSDWILKSSVIVYFYAAIQLVPLKGSDGYWMMIDFIEGTPYESRRKIIVRTAEVVSVIFIVMSFCLVLCSLFKSVYFEHGKHIYLLVIQLAVMMIPIVMMAARGSGRE